MLLSMTGFGKSSGQFANKKISVEIKSLNSKSADINARIPILYREKEIEIRKQITDKLERGKIDFTLAIESTGDRTSSVINADVVRGYMAQMQQITNGDPTELLKMAVRMPDALITPLEEIDAEEYAFIEQKINEAITLLYQFREAEGEALTKEFQFRIENIRKLLYEVEIIDPERLSGIRERLNKSVEDLRDRIDENRFEQELIFYLEKLDISEEKLRLANHLDYFLQTMNEKQSNGRKLGFICQEIGREINTLGSKANFAPMQQRVVQMKDELEKIKEQVLNVL